MRTKEIYDGAIPSGNSVMFYNLIRIARVTSVSNYEDYANNLLDYLSESVQKAPSSTSLFLSAYEFMIGPSYEIIIASNRKDPGHKILSIQLNKSLFPIRYYC